MPMDLVLTPGKLIIENYDMRIVDFLTNPTNSPLLDFIALVERCAFILPALVDHVFVVHKLFILDCFGFKAGLILHTKFEFHHHECGVDTVYHSFEVGDIQKLKICTSEFLESVKYRTKITLTRLHSYSNPHYSLFSRQRTNSL